MKKIRLATRKSALALWQTEHVAARLRIAHPEIEVVLVPMSTRGDRILDKPLADIGGKGLFLKELESELCPRTCENSGSCFIGSNHVTELMEELRIFFKLKLENTLDNDLNFSKENVDKRHRELILSWGDVVSFFREDSLVMQKWMEEVEGSLLPQNRAALHLPFRTCDEQRKGIVHPLQFCEALMRFSNALKVIAGTTLLKQLRNLDIAMPILIDRKTGSICNVKEWNTNCKSITF